METNTYIIQYAEGYQTAYAFTDDQVRQVMESAAKKESVIIPGLCMFRTDNILFIVKTADHKENESFDPELTEQEKEYAKMQAWAEQYVGGADLGDDYDDDEGEDDL